MSIAREVLNKGIAEWLATAVGKQVGLVTIAENPTAPYVILYPLQSPPGAGSYADPEEDRDFVYQATCVGIDPRQAAWMSRKVQEAFTDRQAGTSDGYKHPIAISGIAVQWRSCDELGAILPVGDDLFQSQDTYRVRAGK